MTRKKRPFAELSGAEQTRKKRPRGRPFPKGTSGNPGGQSREQKEMVAALKSEGDSVHKALMKLVRKGNTHAVLYAHSHLAGKPPARVEISGPDGGPMQTETKTQVTAEVTHDASPEFKGTVLGILARSGALDAEGGAEVAAERPNSQVDEVHQADADGAADGVPSRPPD